MCSNEDIFFPNQQLVIDLHFKINANKQKEKKPYNFIKNTFNA